MKIKNRFKLFFLLFDLDSLSILLLKHTLALTSRSDAESVDASSDDGDSYIRFPRDILMVVVNRGRIDGACCLLDDAVKVYRKKMK